ncbi:MAG: hypothetical protein ACWGQW_12520, partial [bacterium]
MITTEKAKNIIRGCLYAHGFSLLPKGDGRVEIPQKLIQLLPWKNTREVYLFHSKGGFVVSADPEYDTEVIGKVRPNQGRVRLPYGSLRELGLDKRPLVASLGEDNSIFIRNDCSVARLNGAINDIPSETAISLAQILMGEQPDVEVKVEVDVPEEWEADVIESYEPEIILPNTRRPITFRPLQDPYRFRGHWNDGEIVIGGFSRYTSPFYLIGGYEKLGQGQIRVGYLLATPTLQDLLRAARQRAIESSIADGEWIIKFDPGIREEFRVFNSPCCPHPDDQKIKSLFDGPQNHQFLLKTFRKMETEMI